MVRKKNEDHLTVMEFRSEGQIMLMPEDQVIVEPMVEETHEEKSPSLLKSQGGDG